MFLSLGIKFMILLSILITVKKTKSYSYHDDEKTTLYIIYIIIYSPLWCCEHKDFLPWITKGEFLKNVVTLLIAMTRNKAFKLQKDTKVPIQWFLWVVRYVLLSSEDWRFGIFHTSHMNHFYGTFMVCF